MKRIAFGGGKAQQFLAALALVFVGLPSATSALEPLSQGDQKNLRKIVVDLKKAILDEDVERILRHVSRSRGLRCTDTIIPYQQIKKDLYNKNSHLYMSLFDSARFSRQCGSQYPADYPAISERDFFITATNESIDIAPIERGWAKVTIKSQTKGHYPREWFFHKEGREWKLTNGFVVSRCSCG